MRNGLKLRKLIDPIERRTMAPAPSGVSVAYTFLVIVRETDCVTISMLGLEKNQVNSSDSVDIQKLT